MFHYESTSQTDARHKNCECNDRATKSGLTFTTEFTLRNVNKEIYMRNYFEHLTVHFFVVQLTLKSWGISLKKMLSCDFFFNASN